jgi:transcriptional regulator with XRE-family HTH domain
VKIYRHPKQSFADPFAGHTTIRAEDVVKSARQWVDATQTALAERGELDQRTISAWERGRQEPSFAAVMKVLGACGLDLVVTPVVREGDTAEPARVVVTGGQSFPRNYLDGIARNRRLRRAQLRQYARERP